MSIQRPPVLKEFSDAYLTGLGYIVIRVSVFDHWLSEDEASNSGIISFSTAKKSGKLGEYQEGEQRMISFYKSITKGSFIYSFSGRAAPSSIDEGEFDFILKESLREKKLMDILVFPINLRVVGGYDRTDLLLLSGEAERAFIESSARAAGVFLLR